MFDFYLHYIRIQAKMFVRLLGGEHIKPTHVQCILQVKTKVSI